MAPDKRQPAARQKSTCNELRSDKKSREAGGLILEDVHGLRIDTEEHRTMIKFLLPIAINVINKAVDKIPEDLDDLLKKFVVALLKKDSSQEW